MRRNTAKRFIVWIRFQLLQTIHRTWWMRPMPQMWPITDWMTYEFFLKKITSTVKQLHNNLMTIFAYSLHSFDDPSTRQGSARICWVPFAFTRLFLQLKFAVMTFALLALVSPYSSGLPSTFSWDDHWGPDTQSSPCDLLEAFPVCHGLTIGKISCFFPFCLLCNYYLFHRFKQKTTSQG